MQRNELLAASPLFEGSTSREAEAMLGCMEARERRFSRGAYIHRMGDIIRTVGLVVDGSVRIESVDAWGDVSVMGMVEPGGMFGEAYAAVPDEPLMVDVVAAQDCTIVFLSLSKVLSTCSRACPHHSRASANMTAIIARHSLALSRRIFHVAPKTIRGKVLAYLSDVSERAGSREFDIPYNRQQLADYLGVDRSALSAELSRMQKMGLIETRRSHFILRSPNEAERARSRCTPQ